LNPATLILAKSLSGRPALSMLAVFHFRHGWFFAIFLFCSMLVVANVVHYILFRVLHRKESTSHPSAGACSSTWGNPLEQSFFSRAC
jgi:hypothetical protein